MGACIRYICPKKRAGTNNSTNFISEEDDQIKTKVKVIGIVENMAGFICPHCNKKTDIFEANTGGGDGLCKEFNLNLIGRLPLEPQILQSSEKGNYFPDSFPGTETSKEIEKIVENVLKI